MQNNQMALFGHFFGHYVNLRIIAEVGKHSPDLTTHVETGQATMTTRIALLDKSKPFVPGEQPVIQVQENYVDALGYYATVTLLGPEVDDVRPTRGEVQSVPMSKYPTYFDSFFQFLQTGKWENVPSWPLTFDAAVEVV